MVQVTPAKEPFRLRQIYDESESSIESKIYAAYEVAAKKFDGYGIAIGTANAVCDRALWYAFRWASEQENIEGRMLRLFQTGHIEEDRIVADLNNAGIPITGQQDKMLLVSGHVRGKRDGEANNVPGAEKTPHLAEFKSMNKKWMDKMKHVRSVKTVKPEYYGQCQLGMHFFGLTRCLFVATCKDDDRYYTERIKYDFEWTTALLARLRAVVESPIPPKGVCRDEHDNAGRFCKHKAVCFGWQPPRRHCRTCMHSAPEMDGNARWSCARHARDLTFNDQPAGCPNHLFITALVPGEVVEQNREAEYVTYRLPSGGHWTNRAGE